MPSTVLVAFTSARGDRPLYRRDALNALACPERWVLSLSYRQKWIARELEEELRTNRLAGKQLLIVLCGALRSDGTFQDAVPLRFCRVIETSLVDDGQEGVLALLNVESGARPTLMLAANQADNGAVAAAGAPPFALLRGVALPHSSAAADRDQGDTYLRWLALPDLAPNPVGLSDHVEALAKRIPELAECWHFMLTEFSEIRSSFASRPVQISSRPHGSAMTMVDLGGGRLYQMQFYMHRDTLVGANRGTVELVLNGEHVEISQPMVRQHGSGSAVQYLLAVTRTYAAETANLLIHMRRQEDIADPASALPAGPELQLLLRIRPPRGLWLLLILLLTVGTLGLQMSKEALQGMGLPATEVFVLVAKAMGGLIVALTGWLAFRRLPIKI
jgi:hypothetical protein